MITGRQIAAARVLLGLSLGEIADRADISVTTLRRIEDSAGEPWGTSTNITAVCSALQAAGIRFIPENGGGAGVRLRDCKG